MLKVGDVIPLSLQLDDGTTDKFVRAVVRDASGSPITGSPFSCAHVAGGQYESLTALMPNTAFVTVQFKVYTDSGFTTLSTSNGDAQDIFELNDDRVRGEDELIGTVEDESPLVGVVDTISPLIGSVEEC